MREGPYFPDTRPGRKAVVHHPQGRSGGPGTVWCEADTSEIMADAFNRAFQAGREAALLEVRQVLGVEKAR